VPPIQHLDLGRPGSRAMSLSSQQLFIIPAAFRASVRKRSPLLATIRASLADKCLCSSPNYKTKKLHMNERKTIEIAGLFERLLAISVHMT
jgi:hypothetical protein